MLKNEADIGIVTRAIKNCYNTMACCLMDGGQFPTPCSKLRYGYRWSVDQYLGVEKVKRNAPKDIKYL